MKKRFNRILAKNQILEELKEQKMKETESKQVVKKSNETSIIFSHFIHFLAKSVQVYDLRLSNANPQNPSLSDLKLYQAIEKDILMENLSKKISNFLIFLKLSGKKQA